ncbi:MAG TPA: LexA family transcriptional regulator [Fimbriimonadaceae bacterium]|nr:LexA family transcriptional regulator [Fimbriimonadaceae bacterium]
MPDILSRVFAANFAVVDPVTGYGERIRALREAKGWPRQKLADLLKVSEDTVRAWESERVQLWRAKHDSTVEAIAEQLGTSVESLMLGTAEVSGSAPGIDPPNPLGSRGAVPGAGRRWFPIRFFAGASAHPVESGIDGEDYEEFSDRLYRAERYCVIVVGDSGEPRIKHGDILLIQPHPSPRPGVLNICASEAGETLVKIAKGDEDRGWRFTPINPDYPDVEPADGTQCLGYVVGLKRNRGRDGYLEEGENAGLRP